ncbi:MAG: hypothetical protein PSV35_06035, partial [bacterium]|nr:hypothetical protein [bacterium]
WKKKLQIWNLLVLTAATYDLITNPEATYSEVGMDIAIHALSILNLNEDANILLQLFTSGANVFRTGAIYAGVTSGASHVPQLLNYLDVVTHSINAGFVIAPGSDSEEDELLSSKMQ